MDYLISDKKNEKHSSKKVIGYISGDRLPTPYCASNYLNYFISCWNNTIKWQLKKFGDKNMVNMETVQHFPNYDQEWQNIV